MGIENFKPTLWHGAILTEYENSTVFASLANRSLERDIRGYGDRVKINSMGDFAASNYVPGTVPYQNIIDTSQFLDIDQKKIVPVQLDSIDNAQANPKVFGTMVQKMAYAMRDTIDAALGGTFSQGDLVSGTTGSPTSITSANINSFLGSIGVAMDEDNIPTGNRVAVVPPWFAEKCRLGRIVKDTANSAYLAMNSYMGEMAGFSIFASNNVSKSGTDWYAPMFFNAFETIAFAEQLEEMIMLKDKDYPTYDFVNLVAVYGLKVVRSEALKYAYVEAGSESTI